MDSHCVVLDQLRVNWAGMLDTYTFLLKGQEELVIYNGQQPFGGLETNIAASSMLFS